MGARVGGDDTMTSAALDFKLGEHRVLQTGDQRYERLGRTAGANWFQTRCGDAVGVQCRSGANNATITRRTNDVKLGALAAQAGVHVTRRTDDDERWPMSNSVSGDSTGVQPRDGRCDATTAITIGCESTYVVRSGNYSSNVCRLHSGDTYCWRGGT